MLAFSRQSREAKFHAAAEKNYRRQLQSSSLVRCQRGEEKKGKKAEKKQSVLTIQRPNPGKPADLSRMRRILLELKHYPPDPHMKSVLAAAPTMHSNDATTKQPREAPSATPRAAAFAATSEAVAAA
ncbi:putative Clathrin light chain 2 [Cocos nucifera]|uniref:Putative Clathrin light chain 2 n=1 Tax=Cocos nucifera TaxID=13894 RepID=A0A8K0I4C4_COCNU|nr:putative Clathrin light chain 2 [Cocos nucifera]